MASLELIARHVQATKYTILDESTSLYHQFIRSVQLPYVKVRKHTFAGEFREVQKAIN